MPHSTAQPPPTTPGSCPACDTVGARATIAIPDYEYRTGHTGHYADCPSCHSCFQHPMPTFAQLGSYYPANYHAAISHGLIAELRHAGRLRQLRPLFTGPGALLDYGCGNGAFLLWAATQGLNRPLIGYEISAHNTVERLADGLVTIVRGQPEHLFSVLPRCRVITLNHVIEHLPDPLATITSLAPFLLPGGSFQGQTPATDSLERAVFGSRWSGYHSPRHTVVFSRRGLRALFARAGLGATEVKSAFNPAAVAVSLSATLHNSPRGIVRRGPLWLGWLAGATLLAPFDLLSGRGAIMDFQAARLEPS